MTTTASILSVLRRGRRSGLTAELIASRAKLNLNTTRNALLDLRAEGQVQIVGTERTGSTGRPANLYTLVG